MVLKTKNGFTLSELLVILFIIGILLSISIPSLMSYYRTYKYNEYVVKVESTLKWARFRAIERGVNVGICLNNQALTAVDVGRVRVITCNETAIMSVNIESSDQNFVRFEGVNLPIGFDPRGLVFSNQSNSSIESFRIRIKRIDSSNLCTEYVLREMSNFIERRECQ